MNQSRGEVEPSSPSRLVVNREESTGENLDKRFLVRLTINIKPVPNYNISWVQSGGAVTTESIVRFDT